MGWGPGGMGVKSAMPSRLLHHWRMRMQETKRMRTRDILGESILIKFSRPWRNTLNTVMTCYTRRTTTSPRTARNVTPESAVTTLGDVRVLVMGLCMQIIRGPGRSNPNVHPTRPPPREVGHLLGEMLSMRDKILILLRRRDKSPSWPLGLTLQAWEAEIGPCLGANSTIRVGSMDIQVDGCNWRAEFWRSLSTTSIATMLN